MNAMFKLLICMHAFVVFICFLFIYFRAVYGGQKLTRAYVVFVVFYMPTLNKTYLILS